MNFEEKRRKMVERQLKGRDIRDERVLEVMGRVRRHCFVPEEWRDLAYDDRALPLELSQTISQPYMVAAMTQSLALEGGERVLEVGTGSGYQAAVLAELAGAVFTVERHAEIAEKAARLLAKLDYRNITVKNGDGCRGWPEEAPFDCIIVTAGAPRIPEPLVAQLVEGGCISIPVGGRNSQRLLRAVKLTGGTLREEHLTHCTFVPLLGEGAW